jgi:hypothetical protein
VIARLADVKKGYDVLFLDFALHEDSLVFGRLRDELPMMKNGVPDNSSVGETQTSV